jgi:hypothetical protein
VVFKSKLLQRRGTHEAILRKIYDTYIAPNGSVEGADPDLTRAVEHRDELIGRGVTRNS